MDKLKEIANDPAKLEEAFKKGFEKLDAEKKGYITHEVLKQGLIAQAKGLGFADPEKEITPEEMEKAKKIADPDGTGKIVYENFVKLMHAGLKKAKEKGKI